MNQRGYTLIELIMAMAIFSMMLLIISLGVLSLMRIYQNGIASRNTQQNARYGMEQMVRSGRSAYKAEVTGAPNNRHICFYIANSGLEYYINGGRLNEVTLLSPTSPCDGSSGLGHSITSSDVVVTKLNGAKMGSVSNPGDSLSLQLDLEIGTGNSNGSLNVLSGQCKPGAGDQFCSITALHSSVTLRGGQGAY